MICLTSSQWDTEKVVARNSLSSLLISRVGAAVVLLLSTEPGHKFDLDGEGGLESIKLISPFTPLGDDFCWIHMLFFISRSLPITSTGSVFPVAFCTAGSYTYWSVNSLQMKK